MSAMAERRSAGARWHQALAFALTGRRRPELGEQPSPAVAELARLLQSSDGSGELADHVDATRRSGEPWPHPVPTDLMSGLGYAQFSAALTQLQSELGLDRAPTPRVGPGRPSPGHEGAGQLLSAAERRLLDEVPPHHGS